MKTVMLLRHAKSSWDHPGLSDLLRPLAPRGMKAAPRMGEYMAEEGLVPDRVLCSPARRAVDTWALVAERLDGSPEVEIRGDLYHAVPGDLVLLLRNLPDPVSSVLLVVHNRTLEELALSLAGHGEEDSLSELSRKYPTGALAVLDFSADRWTEIEEGAGHLRAFVRPRSLKS